MAEYTDPYITKLLDLDIVYCADDRYKEKYLDLRKKAQAILNSPFSDEDKKRVTAHFDNAMREYGHIMLSDTAAECRYASARMICSIEYLIYLANKSYIKRGVRRIPEELKAMEKLPKNFLQCHHLLVMANTIEEIKSCSTALMNTTKEFADHLKDALIAKKEITAEAIEGTYEEIFSNWRSKMYHAAENGDTYLSLMTAASCQEFYDEISDEYDVEKIQLFHKFRSDDLLKSCEAFESAMEQYKDLYAKCGKSVRYYSSIDVFEKDYLR